MQEPEMQIIDRNTFKIIITDFELSLPTEILLNVNLQNSKFSNLAEHYFNFGEPMVLPLDRVVFVDYILPYLITNKIPKNNETNQLGLTNRIIEMANYLNLRDFVDRFKEIKLKIITMTRETFFIQMKLENNVKNVKQKIKEHSDIPEDMIRLIYKGRQLEDKQSLDELNVKDIDDMSLVLKVTGD